MSVARRIIGIDEVGRGPLAGPLAVGAFSCSPNLLRSHFRGVKDSKQLTADEREAWYVKIEGLRGKKHVQYAVTFVHARTLDRIGLSRALRSAISSCLLKLDADAKTCRVLLDGGIAAPDHFLDQKTIIKGDEKEPIIALASIVAKVRRDRYMQRKAKLFPDYLFDEHKGYGTAAHRERIKRHGPCILHRRSFLKNFTTI